MIIIALGSNIPSHWGDPEATLKKSLALMPDYGITPLRHSRFLTTTPFGHTDQPSFVNAIAIIATKLSPIELLTTLHDIEASAGRVRLERWGPRPLDLDIIDYDGQIIGPEKVATDHLRLPHPGIAERVFVLQPLSEIASDWRHPITGLRAADMLAAHHQTDQGIEFNRL